MLALQLLANDVRAPVVAKETLSKPTVQTIKCCPTHGLAIRNNATFTKISANRVARASKLLRNSFRSPASFVKAYHGQNFFPRSHFLSPHRSRQCSCAENSVVIDSSSQKRGVSSSFRSGVNFSFRPTHLYSPVAKVGFTAKRPIRADDAAADLAYGKVKARSDPFRIGLALFDIDSEAFFNEPLPLRLAPAGNIGPGIGQYRLHLICRVEVMHEAGR